MALQTDNQSYYEVLHVNRGAPQEIIRASYRALMQQLKMHPDLGGDTATAALINEAYAVLTDCKRRAEYDAQLDIMSQVVQGIPEAHSDPGSAAVSDRFLDPSRECVFCETPHNYRGIIGIDADCQTCCSPLRLAENSRLESACQRAVHRMDRRRNIIFYTHWPQSGGFTGQTEDISLHGLRFATTQALNKGRYIKIVSEIIEAVANVRHCVYERRGRTTRCVAGVSFVTLRLAQSVGGFVSERI